nr:sigma-70 family RNA polymerase sigma factor [uncultured Acetatifactor sp.]
MEKQELEVCINAYGKALYSFCRQLAGNRQEADELYQDTFLRAMELSEKVDYTGNPKSYLLSVALRIWKNRRRKFAWRKRIADMQPIVEGQDVESVASTEPSPEEQVIGKEEQAVVRQAVDKLPERLKLVVLLFYMEELSVKQTAEILKIPAGTVLSRLHQARKTLKKELESVINGKGTG